mmetsp:Transcript_6999/g.21355  ORF Transcript_6999/g.21355 Transcript_6999/m.21355 type:complete len:334 (+) Transcript_6999:632-1633(+)
MAHLPAEGRLDLPGPGDDDGDQGHGEPVPVRLLRVHVRRVRRERRLPVALPAVRPDRLHLPLGRPDQAHPLHPQVARLRQRRRPRPREAHPTEGARLRLPAPRHLRAPPGPAQVARLLGLALEPALHPDQGLLWREDRHVLPLSRPLHGRRHGRRRDRDRLLLHHRHPGRPQLALDSLLLRLHGPLGDPLRRVLEAQAVPLRDDVGHVGLGAHRRGATRVHRAVRADHLAHHGRPRAVLPPERARPPGHRQHDHHRPLRPRRPHRRRHHLLHQGQPHRPHQLPRHPQVLRRRLPDRPARPQLGHPPPVGARQLRHHRPERRRLPHQRHPDLRL